MGVAAVRIADMLRVEKLRETILGGSPCWPRLRASRAKVESLVRGKHDNGDRTYSRGAMQQIEAARVIGRFQAVGFD